VLGRTVNLPNPGNIPTIISANPNLKPELSKSATIGLIFQPAQSVDLAIDAWYFHRTDEIRVERSLDILDRYIANPSGPQTGIVRDPNPETWLPGIPNSGPIILLQRRYDNYEFTKAIGIDYDLNWRLPATSLGKFTLGISGTATRRFDQLPLAGTPVQKLVGTATVIEIPKTRGSIRVGWSRGDWSAWTRYNHTDKTRRSTTANCELAATPTDAGLVAKDQCHVGADKTFDMGFAYDGIKNLTITGSLLNVMNNYDRSIDIPNTFNYWDSGTPGQLGRRFTVSATYKFW
jgi:iron complex outermembrane recepter protein